MRFMQVKLTQRGALYLVLLVIVMLLSSMLLSLFMQVYDTGFAVEGSSGRLPDGVGSKHGITPDQAVNSIMAFIQGRGQKPIFLTTVEASHLADVRLLVAVLKIAVPLTLLFSIALVAKPYMSYGRIVSKIMLIAAGASVLLLLELAAFAWINFSFVFRSFHLLLFPQGNFAFPADSVLITLFPESFFMQAALAVIVRAILLPAGYALFGFMMIKGWDTKH